MLQRVIAARCLIENYFTSATYNRMEEYSMIEHAMALLHEISNRQKNVAFLRYSMYVIEILFHIESGN